MDELTHLLEDIFRDVFRDHTLCITDETTSQHVSHWDSLGHLQLLSSIERQFKFRFTLDETMSITSVADLKRVLRAKAVNA